MTLIPKPDNIAKREKYRPVSLINRDFKNSMQILANWTKQSMNHEAGFTSGCKVDSI